MNVADVRSELHAAYEQNMPEFNGLLLQIYERSLLMAERAKRALETRVSDEEVVRWCREHIQIPDEWRYSDEVTQPEVHAAYRHQFFRKAAEVDAMLRAQVELILDPRTPH